MIRLLEIVWRACKAICIVFGPVDEMILLNTGNPSLYTQRLATTVRHEITGNCLQHRQLIVSRCATFGLDSMATVSCSRLECVAPELKARSSMSFFIILTVPWQRRATQTWR